MSKFSVTRNVPFSVDQVFAIAADVAHYNQFLPLVKSSSVLGVKNHPDGRSTFDAELALQYRKLGISEILKSQVVVDPAARTVTATSREKPVKHLATEWKIVAGDNGSSDIHFTVDYALQSKSLQFLMSGMFDLMVRRVMNAFEERARKLYGAAAA